MRVAVIGLGSIGKVHVKVIRETEHELVAVCDTDKEKLSLYPDVKGYVDYLEMLDEVKPNVVHICTPHYLHTEMVLAALNRDIHVLCEKPLCIKEEDISLIRKAESKSKGLLGVCFQNRYNPTTQFTERYLQDKKLLSAHGNLTWHRDREYYESAPWRGKKATEGGGVLINQAIHTIDLLQYFCGMPNAVTAVCENISLQGIIDVEDTAKITMYGTRDATMYATNASTADAPVAITFQTDKEEIRMQSDGVWINGKKCDVTENGAYYGKKIYGVGHRALIYDFYDCIQSRRKFPIDGKEAAKAVIIVLTAYRSEGRQTKLLDEL